ncbi:MAG TPA: hypothetical protein VIP11_19290 [Gemmatimonadaceae bacterium]
MIAPARRRSDGVAAHASERHPVRLSCRAPRAGARDPGIPCNTFLGHVPAQLEFITTADRAPDHPDDTVWLRCTARQCGKWNRFRVLQLAIS